MSPEEYVRLPYHYVVVPDSTEDLPPGWVVTVDELPGCAGQGDTLEDAFEDVRGAMLAWIETVLADGDTVPLPRDEGEYSGQFRLRVPASLHRALAEEARREGVSMNMLAASLLAGGLGWRRTEDSVRQTRSA